MKKKFILSIILCAAIQVWAQDVITLNNGDEIEALVQKIGETEVAYKKWDFQDGPTFTIRKSEIFRIKYQNGTKETFDVVDETAQNDIEERIFAEYKARILAEHRAKIFADSIANAEKLFADSIANAKRIIVEQKIREEKRLADSITLANAIAKKNRKKLLNGHYISIGGGIFSSEWYSEHQDYRAYYSRASYEYRHKIIGYNFSINYGYGRETYTYVSYHYNFLYEKVHSDTKCRDIIASVGIKLYLSNKIELRNLYFNIRPFGLVFRTGKVNYEVKKRNYYDVDYTYSQSNYTHKYREPYAELLFGYSPVWHINKKTSLGFNINAGITTVGYCFETGFVVKFNNKNNSIQNLH